MSAQVCSGDVLSGRARSSREVSWNEHFGRFTGHYEASVSGTLCVDDDCTSMQAWTGSGVLQKPAKKQIIGSSSRQRGPVPGLAEESRGERGLGQVRCT